jgi:hypothetical protein
MYIHDHVLYKIAVRPQFRRRTCLLGEDWRPYLGKHEGVLVFLGDAPEVLVMRELAIDTRLCV